MQDNVLLFEKEEGPSVLASFLSFWLKHKDSVERALEIVLLCERSC